MDERDARWRALRRELLRWLRAGYTRRETPLDDYGREVIVCVLDEMERCEPKTRGKTR